MEGTSATKRDVDERTEGSYLPPPGVPCCMGIDEAGRGPILGPMVYGVALCALSDQERISKMGFMDSKVLKESERERLFENIRKSGYIGWKVDVISPQFLSSRMLAASRSSLNAISYDSAIGLVRHYMDKGVRVEELYVDTVGDADAYRQRLERIFPSIRKITVCSKADALFPVVSAASICAKVSRDVALATWAFNDVPRPVAADEDEDDEAASAESGAFERSLRDLGSGYPGDPATRRWLDRYRDRVFGYPSLVRFSWAPSKKSIEEHCVSVRWADPDADAESAAGQVKKPQAKLGFLPAGVAKRHRFFENRKLRTVHGFQIVPAGSDGGPARKRRRALSVDDGIDDTF